MSIIIANNCTIVNVFHETKVIYSVPIVAQLKYQLDRLKPTTTTTTKPSSEIRERLNCQKTITSQSDGNGSNSNRSSNKVWKQCWHCDYKTTFKGNLKSHFLAMHSHDRSRKGKFEKYHYFQCALCPYGSKHKQALKNHMVARHLQNTDDECPRCHAILKNRMCVRSHLQYCGKTQIHQCEYCGFKTRYRTHLLRHISNVHTDCNTVECPNNCGSILKNKESLRGHLNFCGGELFTVQCRFCPFRPKRKNLLRLHETRVHSDMTNIKNECPKCTKMFKKKAYLKKHIETCDSKKVFQCATCSYTNHKKYLLERHIQQKHLDSCTNLEKYMKFLPCPRCGTGFKTQTGLSEHLLRCGDTVGFQCYHCPFRTIIKNQLKDHILCVHIESNQLHQINMTNYYQSQSSAEKPFCIS